MSKLNKRGDKQFDDNEFIENTKDNGMTANEAILNIENGCDRDTYLESFLYLIQSGVINHLQGSYQREAMRLIDAGLIIPE
jgi:hypothetical protein